MLQRLVPIKAADVANEVGFPNSHSGDFLAARSASGMSQLSQRPFR
jgi:hypothetical protein